MVKIKDNKTGIIHEVKEDEENPGGLLVEPNNDGMAALLFMTEIFFVTPPPKDRVGFETDRMTHRNVDFSVKGDLEYAARNLYGFSNYRYEMVEEESK